MANILFIRKGNPTETFCKDFPTDASARRYARDKNYDFAFRDGHRIYPLHWVPNSTHTFEPASEGIAWCTTCKCAEGTLPTECPGTPVNTDSQDLIYQAKLDYRDGRWWCKINNEWHINHK